MKFSYFEHFKCHCRGKQIKRKEIDGTWSTKRGNNELIQNLVEELKRKRRCLRKGDVMGRIILKWIQYELN
jgi:hypothetical protein